MAGAAVRALKRISVTADRLHAIDPGVVILIYHRVGRRSTSRVDLPKWLFEEQMSIVADSVTTVPLTDAVNALSRGTGPQSVVITFDDGTADFVDEALPVLVTYGIPATLYVATDFVERRRAFPSDGPAVSWSGLRDAMTTGLVTIGSHTHTHALLDRLTAEQAADELDRSKELIGEKLGVTAAHFAYPKALAPTGTVEREVKARFASASLAGTRPNRYGITDLHRLSRSPVQVDDGLRYFNRKLAGGMRLEDEVRRLVNSRRFSGLTS